MTKIRFDIVEGARWREEEGRVVWISRLFRIWDINLSSTPEAVGGSPVRAFAGGSREGRLEFVSKLSRIPKQYDPHPRIPNLVVTQRNIRALSPGTIDCEVIYSRPQYDYIAGASYRLEGSANLELATRTTDPVSGDQLILESGGVKQGAKISVLLPRILLRFSNEFFSNDPFAHQLLYIGSTNDTPFWGEGAKKFLMRSIEFDPIRPLEPDEADTGGEINEHLYRFFYDIEYRPEGHEVVGRFIDPETGVPPIDLDQNSGATVIVEQYDAVDWTTLMLDKPGAP